MYKLVFDEKVIKVLEKLPKQITHRILKKLLDCKEDPFRYFEKLSKRSEFKLGIGDYRAISDIQNNKLIIFVIYIGHRKKMYKEIKQQ